MDLHLARIAERNPAAQRDRQPRRGARPRRGERGRPDAVRRARAAARAAVGVQGHPRRGRVADDLRLAAVRRPRARPRRAHRRADPAGRGGADREDQRAGVRGRVSHTFNTIFGTTLNPVDPTRSAGGSSGGAALRAGGRHGAARRRAPTWAARCATPRRSAAWSGCARASAGCRSGRRTTSGRPPRSAGRWAATSATWRCCCRVLAGPDPRVAAGPGRPGRDVRAARSRGTLARPARRASAPTSAALIEVDARGGGGRRGRRRPRWPPPARGCRPRTPTCALADETFRTLRAWHFQAGFGRPARRAPGRVQAVARRQHPRRRAADRRRRRPRLPRPHRPGRDHAALLRGVRRAACCRPRRCRRSRPTRSTPPTSTASRWRPTWTGCGRRTSSPSPAARPSRCRRGTTRDGLPVGVQIVAAARRRPPAARGRGGLRGARPG